MKIEKIADVAQKIVDLTPLAQAGVTGAINLIKGLIEDLNGVDLTQDLLAKNAAGHAQVDKLMARAAEAEAFLASRGKP